ncbi:MAG: hypothetical protein AB7F21_05515, partial [Desulfuromonadales bacterium]
KGTDGDKMNAILAACGFNLRKLLRAFLWLVFKELERLKSVLALLKRLNWVPRELIRSPGLSIELYSIVA